MKEKDQKKLGMLCCIVGAICWGFSGTCSEALFRSYEIDASWITAIRMILAGFLLLAWVAMRSKETLAAMVKDKKTRMQLLLFSLAGLLVCQYTYLAAIKWSNSGTATVLQNLSIVLITIFTCITTRALPEKRQGISILLAMVGVWLIATKGSFTSLELSGPGLFWGIGAAVGAATYSLLSRNPVSKWGSLPVTGFGMLMGGLVFFACARAWYLPAGLDAYALLLLAIIVLVGTLGAFTLFLQGISMVGPVTAALLACLEPLTAAFLSAVWLGSVFTIAELIGFACVLATVFLLNKKEC